MSGHHPFAELEAKIPPEAMARAAERNRHLSDEIDLATLRQARRLTQQQLAAKMRVKQPEIAKIEKRADMLISTLAGVLHAMGAELKIIASFPGHDVRIQSFGPANGKRNGKAAVPSRRRRVTTSSRRVNAGG